MIHFSKFTVVALLIVAVIALSISILPSPLSSVAKADDYYTVDTGTIVSPATSSNAYSQGINDSNRLVRWPDGTLISVYTKYLGSAYELYVVYSIDEGLNWSELTHTVIGQNQQAPSIAVSSNWDLIVTWCGLGSGDYPTMYALKSMRYDYSEETWGGVYLIHDENSASAAQGILFSNLEVDNDDNLHVSYHYYNSSTGHKIYYMTSDYNGDGTWGSWSAADTVVTGYQPMSMAVDKDGYVGILYDRYFKLRNPSTETWGAQEDALIMGNVNRVSLIATISGGNTIWRASGVESVGDDIWHNTRAAGSWGVQAEVISGTFDRVTMAQEHGSGDGDTGDFYVIGSEAGDNWEYVKFTLGVGWGAEQELTDDIDLPTGTRVLFPYSESADWHWNFPKSNFGFLYANDGGDGWADGNELIQYYISGDWGIFPPIVETDTPTDITKSTATFNGELLADGGATITARGFQYGLTQTPTWSVSQSGSYSAGVYSLPVTGLTGLTNYYVRAYVDSDEGSSYGEWIGFATIDLDAIPSDFTAIPISASQINISWHWIPAPDSNVELEIYYSEDSYPVTRMDGTLIYAGFGNETSATGLEAGTSYYFRGWPYDTETTMYSSTYVEDWATTFGGTGGLDEPDVPAEWFQDPLCTAYSAIPLLWDAIEATNEGFGFPLVTLCVLFTVLWISVLSIGVGGVMLKSGMWTMMISAILILICAMATLLPLWMIAIAIFVGGLPIYNWRRT